MDLEAVQRRLGVEFKDPTLLLEALTHTSCLNEPNIGFKRHNEALAWLGDALIHWVVSERVYCGKLSTQELHNRREKYVGESFLSGLAIEVGLDEVLIMPEGQVKEDGRTKPSNLHTVFEAIVGAIFKDQEFEAAERFVLDKVLQ